MSSTTAAWRDGASEPGQLAVALAQAEASPDGVLVVSPEGRMLYSNRRFAEIWHLPAEILAAGDDEAALCAAAVQVLDPDAFLGRVRHIYADPSTPRRDEIVLRDGRVLDRYGSPLTSADGSYLGWAWYFRDVTAERQAQRELRQLATALQASLLPPRRPDVPGMEIATRYRPADRHLLIGGDFFDVFRVAPNEWGIAMGDVCGKGAPAASLTALARYSLRGAAVHAGRPSEVLRELNAVLRGEPEADERFCSVAYARLELDSCGAWVTLSVAGHPRPLVIRKAGWTDMRGQPGMLLGLFDEPEVDDDCVGLGPGDALVLCTDGITEARNAAGEMFGEQQLQAVLLDHAGRPAEELADAIIGAALSFADGRTHDDVALVVLRVPDDAAVDPDGRLTQATGLPVAEARPGYGPPGELGGLAAGRPAPPREARVRLPCHERSPAEARHFVNAVLRSWRMEELADGDAALLTSEVTANAVRHAQSSFTVILRYDGSRIRVEVGDGSRQLPSRRRPRPEDTGGRGVFLIDQLAAAWGVVPTVEGKRMWFELPVEPG